MKALKTTYDFLDWLEHWAHLSPCESKGAADITTKILMVLITIQG
jgi:hypothetical protein